MNDTKKFDLSFLKRISDNDDNFIKARNQIIELVRNNQKKIGKPDTFALEDYAINIVLQKNIDSYDKVIPQHIKAAKEAREMELNEARKANESKATFKAINDKYQKGHIMTFVKTKGATGTKILKIARLQNINSKKYQELLKSALEQVLDALGISFDEIRGIKKMDAFF